jgi:SAM-dependent methyltransferase
MTTRLREYWSAYIDRQHRQPAGLVGRIIGERMRRQHAAETDWSIDLLQIQPVDRVLELGFGAGRGLALALQRASEGGVVGIDLSETMIRAAVRPHRAAIARGQLALLRGDLANLPFGQQQFDKIFSVHTFYFWPDPGLIARQLLAALRGGGRMAITFATAETLASGERVYWPLHQRAAELVSQLVRLPNVTARLAYGPDSRQYNNVAIVGERV